jgi:hypothetical protein
MQKPTKSFSFKIGRFSRNTFEIPIFFIRNLKFPKIDRSLVKFSFKKPFKMKRNQRKIVLWKIWGGFGKYVIRGFVNWGIFVTLIDMTFLC